MASFKYSFEEIMNGIHKFFDKVEVLYDNSSDFNATSCIDQEVTKLKNLFKKDSDEMKFFYHG